jgi:integrase/recombinase XerD
MVDMRSVRFTGPLTDHVDGFWSALLGKRYSPLTALNHLRVAADFSRWLEGRRFQLERLRDGDVDAYIRSRKRRHYTGFRTRNSLQALLAYLSEHGISIRPAPVERTALDDVLSRYADYLVRVRRLRPTTLGQYVVTARDFTADCLDAVDPQWDGLTGAGVTDFVMRECQRRGRAYIKGRLSQWRSFLRFLHLQGLTAVSLAGGIPAVAGWRLASIPPALEEPQIRRLLGVFVGDSPKALRGAAIVRLLLGLGLRAGDVAGLEIEHIDWRAGEITVCGKGRHVSRLPLPYDVGKVLAAYLRCRPVVSTRRIFIRSRAPFAALTSSGVIAIARTALQAAGVTAGGSHLLRHTAATQMLRKGASLAEIAHVLRHRHVNTTAIYAKVDLRSLQLVARPWPEVIQ